MEYKDEQFEYDAIGNPIIYRNYVLAWEKGRQLKSYGNIASYTYNASGIRTGKTVGTTTTQYFLDGTKILAQKDTVSASESTTTETLMQFIYGVDGILGFTLNNQNYYYKKNLQNDIIAIYDNNLQIIAKYDYDAWGNHKISYLEDGVFVDFTDTISYNEGSNNNLYIALKNPFRYRSYYYDTETGLYYLNSRYYDAEIGRFVNIDDISIINESKNILNGLNLFIYCNDNPVMLTDISGRGWWSNLWNGIKNFFANTWDVIVGGIASVALVAAGLAVTIFTGGSLYSLGATLIGAGVGGFIGGLTNKLNGNSFWGGYLGGAISGGLTGLGVSLGPLGAFLGGFAGNFAGTIITDSINGVNIDLNYVLNLSAESLLSGIVSLGAWKFSTVIDLINIPGFREVYAGMTVWAEFAFNALFNETKKVVKLMANHLRRFLNL